MLFGKPKRKVKRILIVEDEPLTAFENETLLADAGYEVVGTIDGFDEALKVLGQAKVDLILSDVRLRSQQTGVDLARAAKEQGIPTLFATGHPYPEAGTVAIGCLMKPYSEKQLKGAIDAVDRLLSGTKPKIQQGLTLFDQETGAPL